MRNNARSAATTVSSHSYQSRFTSLMCLLLCLTLNLQWLAATSVWNRSNITAQGANLVADGDISIRAANNITLTTAQNTQDSQNASTVKKSGFSASLSPSSISVGYSKSNTNTTGNTSSVTNTGTSIGSIAGNITIQAGNALKVIGSEITAANANKDTSADAGKVTLSGASVAILDVQNTSTAASTYTNKTAGISIGISIPGMSQVQSAQAAASNVGKVTDTRMKAMGAAVALNNAYQGASALASTATALGNGGNAMGSAASGGGGIGITVSASTSKTQQASQTNSSTSQGSSITGSNVTVSATGKDLDGVTVGNAVDKTANPASGNLHVQGSKVVGSAATAISATGDIDLLAGKSTSTTTSANSSKSAGASFTYGAGMSASANFSKSNGNSNESSTTYTNTQIGGGTGAGSNPNSTLSITSGGNTTLTGAVASANQVTSDIKGNLTVTSVQDTYSYQETSKTSGVNLSYTAASAGNAATAAKDSATGGSVTAGKSNTNAAYQAVTEQSGIKTGDGGFQITVGGKTTLTGGVIASTDQAVQNTTRPEPVEGLGVNRFTSAGGVSATDLTNTSAYKATSASITAGVGSSLSSSGAGTGNAKGNETSITQSGISGVTVTNTATGTPVNNTVRTTDTPAPVLANTFAQNKDTIKANVGAQVQITQQFGQQASKAIGDLGDKKLAEAKTLKEQAAALASSDPAKAAALTAQAGDIESNWKEGGTLRVLAHTLTGGLTGNLSGALGAATSQTLVPMLGEQLANSALPLELKQGLLQVAAIAIGTAAGGGSVAGAAAAQNATANNYLTHVQWDQLADGLKGCAAKGSGKAACEQSLASAFGKLSKANDDVLALCSTTGNCDALIKEVKAGTAERDALQAANPSGSISQVGFSNLQTQGEKLANNPTLRGQVALGVIADQTCKLNPEKCEKDAGKKIVTVGLVAASLLLPGSTAGLVGGGALVGGGQSLADKVIDGKPIDGAAAIDIAKDTAIGATIARVVPLVTPLASKVIDNVVSAVETRVIAIEARIATAAEAKAVAQAEATAAKDLDIATRAGRDSDMTTGLVPASQVNKAFTDKGYTAPFTDGTYVNVSVSPAGRPLNMVVSEGQVAAIAEGKPFFGAFATADNVVSQQAARTELAITKEFKPDTSAVMPVEFRTSVVTVDGKVASQTPSSSYPGGGNQTFIDYPAGVPRSDIIKPAGPATLLPEVTPTTSTTTATPMSLANTTPPLAPTVPNSFAPPLPQASTAIEQLKLLPTFAGKTTSQIESELITQGFKSTPANNGGSVWTKDLPDGNTAAIRLDPPTIRSPSKGFADEVPHAHKEIVPTNAVTNGNYSPGKTVTTLDDNCCSTTNPRDTHIPIK